MGRLAKWLGVARGFEGSFEVRRELELGQAGFRLIAAADVARQLGISTSEVLKVFSRDFSS